MTQISKKWIANNAIGGTKFLLEASSAIRAVDRENEVVELLRINSANRAEILGREIDSVIFLENNSDLPETGDPTRLYLVVSTNQLWYYRHGSYREASPQPSSINYVTYKATVDTAILEQQYIELETPAIVESIHAYVHRLALHVPEDLQVHEVSGKTRLTFSGEIAAEGESPIALGDVIRIKYIRK
jgi:hypothetical protein